MNKHIIQSGTARSHEANLITCAYLLASPPMQQAYQRITIGDLDAVRVESVGALTDALIPGMDDADGLLAYAISDPSLLSDEPDGYDHSNQLSPAALLYENLYRQVFAWVEVCLGEIVRLATLIRRVEDARQCGSRLPPHLMVSDPSGIAHALVVLEDRRFQGVFYERETTI